MATVLHMMKSEESDEAFRVNLNVSGTIFTVNAATIMQYSDTMLGAMLSERWTADNHPDKEIFLDRDPVLFRYILGYYRNAKLVIPHTITKAEMYAEIEYFSLPIQKEEIQYDADSLGGMKDTIIDFENNYVESLKKSAQEGAIVACAHELAAILIDQIRKSPKSESVVWRYDEIPGDTFAKGIYLNALGDPLFRQTFKDISERLDYTFNFGANHCKVKRSPVQVVR